MWWRRILALVVAVALVLGAFIVRARIDKKDTAGAAGAGPNSSIADDPGTTRTTKATAATVPTSVKLVCVPELRKVCENVANATITVSIASADDTLGKLAATDDPTTIATAWLTLAPWPELVDAQRARAAEPRSTAFAATTAIGRSPLGIAVKAERAAALAAACGGSVNWRCIGDKAGAPWGELGGQATWGRLTPGHANPTTSATGLVELSAAVTQYLGRSDFVGVDLDNDDTFQTWIRRLETAIPRQAFDAGADTPLRQMLLQPVFDAVAVTEAEMTTDVGTRGSAVTATYPTPAVAASAVIATMAGVALPATLTSALTKAASANGWKPPTPEATGLPSATTMENLQLAWKTWR